MFERLISIIFIACIVFKYTHCKGNLYYKAYKNTGMSNAILYYFVYWYLKNE